MRLALIALGMVACTSATAQHNDVARRNPGYLWEEPTGHPNGNSYPDVRQNPAEHQSAAGVPPGTLSYVWIPRHTNDRGEDESIDGFMAPLGPSSATATYPSFAYYPEVTVHAARAVGGPVEPDLAAAPLFVLAEAPLVFASFGYYESGTNLLTPYLLDKKHTDVVISLKWSRADSRLTPDTLNMWGDAYGDTYSEPVFGFVSPAGVVTPVAMTGAQPGYLNLTYRRTAPSLNARSDWGRTYQSQVAFPLLWGYSVSTYEAPIATLTGSVAWDIAAGPTHASATAVPMLNVGNYYQLSTSVLGLEIELDLNAVGLGTLASAGFITTLDSQGFARARELVVPPLGASAIGLHIGAEYFLLNAAGSALTASTQASWILIDR